MGKGNKPKIEVVEYRLSMHLALGQGPMDKIYLIEVAGKEAWSGSVESNTTIGINKEELFGGLKKEGGVSGIVHVLFGGASQLLPDVVASKLGRTPSTAPGFRGLTTLFFTDAAGRSPGDFEDGAASIVAALFIGKPGFYWSANVPYIPDLSIGCEYFPTGLQETFAKIPRLGANSADDLEGSDFPSLAFYYPLDSANGYGDIGPLNADSISPGASGALETVSGFPSAEAYASNVASADGNALIPGEAAPDMGEENWTFDGWFRFDTKPTSFNPRKLLAMSGAGASTLDIEVINSNNTDSEAPDTSARIRLTAASGAGYTFGGFSASSALGENLPTGVVNHYAVTRKGDSLYVHIDGKYLGSKDVSGESFNFANGISSHKLLGDTLSTAGYAGHVRFTKLARYSAQDYELEAEIFDANPAHMIYDAITDSAAGLGVAAGSIDVDSFADAASVLYFERLGLSMVWVQETAAEDFIQEVLNHIDAVLFPHPRTGLLTLKLIRDDYDVDSIREITPSNARLLNYRRKSYGELVNAIQVIWTDPETEDDSTTPAIVNQAAVEAGGDIVPETVNFYGVRSANLAVKLGWRELRALSVPLAIMEIELDRSFWDLEPAEVCKLSWPELGISEMIVRVDPDINYGGPGKSGIRISAVEDKFGLDDAIFEPPPDSSFVDGSEDPSDRDYVLAFTLPYFAAVNEIDDLAGAAYPEVYVGVLAGEDGEDTYDFQLLAEETDALGNIDFENAGTLSIQATGTLDEALDAEIETTLSSFPDLTQGNIPAAGVFCIIGTGDETQDEWAIFTAVEASPEVYTLRRGILDTTPKAWPAGTRIWILDGDTPFVDENVRTALTDYDFKILPSTSRGILPESEASLDSITLTERPWLPTRPANVTVNGEGFGTVDATSESPLVVEVDASTRNRTTEDSSVLAWDDAAVTPEADQMVTVYVLDVDENIIATHDDVALPFTVPPENYEGEGFVKIKVTAKRPLNDDSPIEYLESLQGHMITVQVGNVFEFEDGEVMQFEDGEVMEDES